MDMRFDKIGIITESDAQYKEAKRIICGDSDIKCYYPNNSKYVVFISKNNDGLTDDGNKLDEFIEKHPDYKLISIQQARQIAKGTPMNHLGNFKKVGIKCVNEREYIEARDFLSRVTETPCGGYHWIGRPITVFVFCGKIDSNYADVPNTAHYLKQYDFKDIGQILLDEIKPAKIVTISKDYTAIVSHGQIKVGCTTLNKVVVEEIISAWNEVNP